MPCSFLINQALITQVCQGTLTKDYQDSIEPYIMQKTLAYCITNHNFKSFGNSGTFYGKVYLREDFSQLYTAFCNFSKFYT